MKITRSPIPTEAKREVLSYHQILETDGLYAFANYKNDARRIIVTGNGHNSRAALYISHDSVQKLSDTAWTADKFVPVSETLTLTFDTREKTDA